MISILLFNKDLNLILQTMKVNLKPAVIIDNGSGYIKIGINSQGSTPQIFPSIIGQLKYNVETKDQTNKSNASIGKEIDEAKKRLYKFRYPINRGNIQNWDDMLLIWNYAYQLLKISPKEHPVIITLAKVSHSKQRQKILQMLFQKLQVPAALIVADGIASLFSTGKQTGIVLNCGDGITQVTPIYQGFSLNHCAHSIQFAGRDVTEHLRNLLKKSGVYLDTTADYQIVKGIKQKFCAFLKKDEQKKQKFNLPDDQIIQISNNQREAGQVLFSPEKAGIQHPSVIKLVANTLSKVDIDLKQRLYEQIILAGGSTMIQGFPQRFILGAKEVFPAEAKFRCYAPPNRNTMAWQGGKIFANLSQTKDRWITKQEYSQNKLNIAYKKFIG